MSRVKSAPARKLDLLVLHVLRVRDLTPNMRRVVLGGEGLARFDVPRNALGPYVKLLIPPRGLDTPAWPILEADGRLTWPEPDRRPVMRTYTVRHLDPSTRELHIDFVLHGDSGIGSRWAADAAPGTPVGIWGPGCVTAQNIDWYLLAGDHTALPAIGFILENLPPDAKGQAFIQVPSRADELPLVGPKGLSVTWLHGHGRGEAQSLLDAVRSAAWPEGRPLVWAGAEASLARAIRLYARKERRLDRDQCHILNYWKSGAPEGSFDYGG
ncbi:siderophore-interacting protein [Microvirga pudoricolor]|uniref:siderophore-interacting protein n=1 Tax=Microvirga pudoricolor TaxID=2778729 RepID=UPI00195172E2|nr:siderophore-interacting protein [Microvirga pudoricolor]MBM6593311.1 siderophore-interacting protein [Microvirga pudoricolor]